MRARTRAFFPYTRKGQSSIILIAFVDPNSSELWECPEYFFIKFVLIFFIAIGVARNWQEQLDRDIKLYLNFGTTILGVY